MQSADSEVAPSLEVFNEHARLRERLLSGVLWSAVVGFTVAAPAMAYRGTPTLIIVLGVCWLLVSTVAVRKRLPFWLRLGVLMSCLYVAAAASIAARGYAPNAFLVLGLMVVLATLVVGRRTGLVTAIVTALTMLALTLLQHSGVIVREANWVANQDSASLSVIARVTAIFLAVMIAFVVAISYVVEHSEQLALQMCRSLAELQLEQVEKSRIMSELEQREVALEALTRTLEQRVEERTLRLQQTNDALAKEMQVRLQMEVELRQAQKLESIGRLAAGVAHEINTPLQFVSDNVQFVQDSEQDLARLIACYRVALAAIAAGQPAEALLAEVSQQEQTLDLEYLQENLPAALVQSQQGLARAAAIVKSLKAFSQPDHGEMTWIDLNQAIQNTLVIAANEYSAVAELTTEFAALPEVRCYPGEINQAILNVVVNAAHAIADRNQLTRTKGRIAVRTERDGDAVVVTVSDTGAGIPEAIRERIYDPFFSTKDVGRGAGQGLAITRSVIHDKHGGRISFETEIGHGTTFFLRLPINGAQTNKLPISSETERAS